jgi:serine-type D-Ala-D-Ala carboxypeptidase (penicillin-binding protein 5/6)
MFPPAAPASAQTMSTVAPHAMVMDYESGAVLLDKAADEATAPASIAKLMTAELVFRDLKKGVITLDTPIYVSERAWKAGSRGTSMFARVNSNIRVEDLLRGLIVQSGNDAAIALAEGLGGSEENFAAMMNVRAGELGLTHSHFTDSWGGPDPAQTVSARDMAKLAAHLIRTYPDYYHFFGEKEFTWSKIRQLNRNPILFNDMNGDGLKVGNLPDAGFNLVGSATSGSQRLIVVILDAKTARDRAEEARRLFNWGFRGFESRDLFAPGEIIGAAKLYGGEKSEVPLISDVPLRLLILRGSAEKLTGKIVYTGPLIAPVAAGQTVARLKIYRGSTLALDAPLKTGEEAPLGSLSQRSKDAALELGMQLFHKGVAGALRLAPKKDAAPAAQ